MYNYHGPPLNQVNMDRTVDMVTTVVWRLLGRARTGGTDYVSLKNGILHFLEASRKLRLVVTYFVECLANHKPSCVACYAPIAGRIIINNKKLGVFQFKNGKI